MHLHIGLAQGTTIFGFVLLFGTLWHVLAMWLAGQDGRIGQFGQAMAFMY